MKKLGKKIQRKIYDPHKHHDHTIVVTSYQKPPRVYRFLGHHYRLYWFSIILAVLYLIVASVGLVWLTVHYFRTDIIFKENEALIDIRNKYYEKLEDERLQQEVLNKGYSISDIELKDILALPDSTKVELLKYLPSGQPFFTPQPLTSGFGYRIHPIFHIKKLHEGQDFGVPIGTPVTSTAQGYVSYVGDKSGYGHVMEITHSYGFKTLYAHLSQFKVAQNDFIAKGQQIALSGNSGQSSGPHLHYEVLIDDEPLNPEHFVNWSLNNFDYVFKQENQVEWVSFLKAATAYKAPVVALASSPKAHPLKAN